MTRICNLLGFSNFEIIKSRGQTSGLTLMWRDELKVKVEWKSDRIFLFRIAGTDGKKDWNLFACHGTPYPKEKQDF